MKIWIGSFFVLFAIAELFQWLKGFTLPMPVYIVGGALLAIASNYDRRTCFPFEPSAPASSSHPALTDTSLPPQRSPLLSGKGNGSFFDQRGAGDEGKVLGS
jgi:hypothetical protein